MSVKYKRSSNRQDYGSQCFLKDLFLGEGQAVDSFEPVGATNEDEGDAGVVQHAVLHPAPLVNSQAIVNIEHLLIVLQIGVS